MKSTYKIVGLVICLLLISSFAMAEILRVPDDYETVQAAINNADSGDTILIAKGVYSEFNLQVRNKENIIILGEGIDQTIFDAEIAEGNPSSFLVVTDSKSIVIDGITIKNTRSNAIRFYGNCKNVAVRRCKIIYCKGGILVMGRGRITGIIANNYISRKELIRSSSNNNAIDIETVSSQFLVEKNIITGYHSSRGYPDDGNGIWFYSADEDSPTTIKNNLIYNCDNGIIAREGSVNLTIENNTITDCSLIDGEMQEWNRVNYGNGIKLYGRGRLIGNIRIKNNIIVHNESYGIVLNPDVFEAELDVSYNDVWRNGDGREDNYNGLERGRRDISANPRFISRSRGDYHLRPGTRFPNRCIDGGDPESDYSFEPEPNGERINLGAYGNTPEAASEEIE